MLVFTSHALKTHLMASQARSCFSLCSWISAASPLFRSYMTVAYSYICFVNSPYKTTFLMNSCGEQGVRCYYAHIRESERRGHFSLHWKKKKKKKKKSVCQVSLSGSCPRMQLKPQTKPCFGIFCRHEEGGEK